MEDHAEILSMGSSVTALRGTLELCVIQVGDSYVFSLRANGIFRNRSSCSHVKGLGLGLAAGDLLYLFGPLTWMSGQK